MYLHHLQVFGHFHCRNRHTFTFAFLLSRIPPPPTIFHVSEVRGFMFIHTSFFWHACLTFHSEMNHSCALMKLSFHLVSPGPSRFLTKPRSISLDLNIFLATRSKTLIWLKLFALKYYYHSHFVQIVSLLSNQTQQSITDKLFPLSVFYMVLLWS